MILAALLLITLLFFFLELIFFVVCSLKDSHKIFMQSPPLHTSYLFYMLLNQDIVVTEKPDGILWLKYVVDKFSGLVLYPLFLHLFYYTLKVCIHNKWSFIQFLILIKV